MVDALVHCSSCDEAESQGGSGDGVLVASRALGPIDGAPAVAASTSAAATSASTSASVITATKRKDREGLDDRDGDDGVLSAAINAHAAYGTGIVDESMKFRADLARPIDMLMDGIHAAIKEAESAELKLMCDQEEWLAKQRVGARSRADISGARKKKKDAPGAGPSDTSSSAKRGRRKKKDDAGEFARDARASRVGVAISIAFPTMAAYRPACSMPMEIGLLADSMADVAKKARYSIRCKYAPRHSAAIKARSCSANADCCGHPDTRIRAKRL
jgi:hypothetical protein